MVCHSNYLSLLSFKSILWCSVHKIFTSWEAFVLPCLGPLETGMGDGLVKTVNIPSLPSEPTLWLLVLQELWAMPFTTAYKWAPYWEFSLNLSVHLTIGMFTSTLPMPGPRYTYIRLISSGHQIVYNREKPEEAISCLFLFVGARRAELSSVVATSQISLSILTYIFKQ